MYKKNNVRTAYKTSRRTSYKKSAGYQGYKSRNKGNISQQYNKYLKLAKEAFRSGDRVQSEYYYQFTDHYFRLMVELGINIEENNNINDENRQINSEDVNFDKDSISSGDEENISSNEEEIVDGDKESIESIPFIAEPSKDKRSRSNK